MKIKVLHVQETVNAGGVERVRLLLARYLDKSVYEQKIVCTFAGGEIVPKIRQEGVEIVPIGRFRGPFDFRQYRKVMKIIDEYKPDIIHGAVFEGVTMACVCGFLKRVPVVIAEETSDPQTRSKKANLLLKLLTLAADRVVAISDGTREYLEQVAKIKPSKIQLINNGVEYSREVSEDEIRRLREQLGIADGEIVIGSVGRLFEKHKRFSDLIEAISLLKNDFAVKLIIVGGGRDMELLRKKAEDCGVADRVLLVGYQEDTSLFYRLMDVFCLVSQYEGFGLVAAEAMLNKLPVVATAVGGLKYVVQDEKTGYLIPVNSPQAIAGKLEVLITDTEKRKRFGQNGYERAMREYSAEAYTGKVDKMYRECMK